MRVRVVRVVHCLNQTTFQFSYCTVVRMLHLKILHHLDYCNYGITDELTRYLQSVENAAARLVTGTRRVIIIISPVLRQLHWLPVR